VRAVGVHKYFGRLHVLKGVDMEVSRGETVCIIGPSGSGKSTFLRCINHLESIGEGRIEVNGHLIGYREKNGRLIEDSEKNIAKQREEIGMVFQRFNLFPHKTALGNVVEAPIQVRGINRAAAEDAGRNLLARVGLADKYDVYPGKLSGGQQQRVAIARALVNNPSMLLADEPTGNLDTRTSLDVIGVFQRLNCESGITIVLVTHEPDIAAFAGRVVTVRDGHILSDRPVLWPRDAAFELEKLPPEEDEGSMGADLPAEACSQKEGS